MHAVTGKVRYLLVLAVAVLAGCGRLGYDALGGSADASNEGSDAPGIEPAMLCGDMSGLASDAPWPLVYGCPTNAGRSRAVGPTSVATRRGPLSVVANLDTPMATVGGAGRIYVQGRLGSPDSKLVAFDAAGSTPRWVAGAAVNFDGGPALGADGRLYATSSYGKVFAHSPDDGAVLNDPQYAGAMAGPVLGGDGGVYFGTSGFGFYALDAATLGQRWFVDAAVVGDVMTAAAVGGGAVFVLDLPGARLLALDAATGAMHFPPIPTGSPPSGSPVLVGDIVAVATDAGLVAFDAATGAERWRYPMPGPAVQPAVLVSGALVTATASGDGVILDRTTGTLLMPIAFGDSPVGSPVVDAADNIYVGTSSGARSFTAATGALRWSDPTVGRVVLGDGTVVIVMNSAGGQLVVLGP